MAHPPHVKAQALASLMVGNSVTEVAKECNVPKQTISRWRPEADAYFREIVQSSPLLREVAAAIRQVLRGLQRSDKTGLKTRVREVRI
jgi:hypothetical protein